MLYMLLSCWFALHAVNVERKEAKPLKTWLACCLVVSILASAVANSIVKSTLLQKMVLQGFFSKEHGSI